ncbi:protein kinase domain-containing protein [Hyalangium versicolor]|uniref:protein kinase domain-containing protein n=1 Tax=Hyalangium versicolor TaxID=2861190 RepID=UPI001CCBB995|nr:protein kinase [Hyalangium versicolor]
MATAGNPPGPVILFSQGGFSYEYLQSLGVGSQGESLLLGRKRTADNILEDVIVKCVALPPGELSADTRRAHSRLAEEARLAAYLKHRCLIRVLGHQQVGATFYTALEHVRGPTLNELVGLALERGKPFSEALILYVGAEVASALAHVHTRTDEHGRPLGIVHRNLDTDTVRLTWRGAVKLADFGRALSQLPGRYATTLRRPRGPLFFTAPEALLNWEMDARSDLFTVGLVLLEFATGRHLFDAPDKTLDDMRALLPVRQHRRVEQAVRAAAKAGHADVAEQVLWSAATFTSADVEEATAPLSPALKVHPGAAAVQGALGALPDGCGVGSDLASTAGGGGPVRRTGSHRRDQEGADRGG